MSTSTNTNYAPPPKAQLNMMNGMPPTMTQQQQMQQILQQKQQLPNQQMQQQQPVLQQTIPNSSAFPTAAMFNNNMMSKFMPPNVNIPTATSTPTLSPIAPPQTNKINGPLSNAKPSHQMLSNNNLPAHLRPPNMQYSTAAGSTTLTNGTNGSISANGVPSTHSSRTASPSLQSPQQSHPTPTIMQQQQYQQNLRAPSQTANTSSANIFPLNANVAPSANSNITTLSNNMQNLNLQHSNGTTATIPSNMPQTPQPIFQNQQQQSQNLPVMNSSSKNTAVPAMPQTTFKTSALNAPDVVPSTISPTTINGKQTPISTHPSSMFGTKNPQIVRSSAAVHSTYGSQTTQPSPSTTQAGGSSANMPPMMNQPPPQTTTATSTYMPTPPRSSNMPPTTTNGGYITSPQLTTSSTVPATTTTTSTGGMRIGGAYMPTTTPNNLLQQQQQFQPQQELQQQPTGITQQKRSYPQQTLLPPMPAGAPAMQQSQQQQQQQQQQQYPYSQAYQQPLQQQFPGPQLGAPSMFNGQTNSGPLQYQNQMSIQQQQYPGAPLQQQQQPQPNILQHGFSRLWGQDTIDLMQNRHILTPATLSPPKVVLHNQFHESINCNPSIMRCTIAKIPESNSLLQKSRLPLGILIHPFRDINSLPVIQCPNIVRCRLCRTYINPFVYFVDSKMWKCNLCYRVNELPDDFQFDPATKTYGDVTRRPEVRSSTIEFIAPSEYMLRPPQPAIYLFLFDVSIIAQQCGYLENVCALLSKHLEDMPGDARAQVGFIAYNSNVHFYSMADGYNQPHEMTLLDIDDVFLPRPDNLLVNLKECKELIKDLLTQLPKRFADTHDPGSALGAALQVAYKLMQASGGRVTVFQTCLPNKGPGSLEPREDPNNRSAKDVAHLNPATDFYKRYALECSGYQIAVDLFLLNQQYSDIATISGISKHSGGCVHHIPLYQKTKPHNVETLKNCLKRYLTRKIGFEAVMRIRCTRGLQVHTFHGNFFVRSTDLLSLPNVNPDAGYGMQISYEESLSDVKTICFQAALLYTNSEGERRIRVHTLCLPVTASLPEVMHAADTEAIIGLLTKMAVDRSITSNIADAREAFMNATVDILNAFKIAQNLPSGQTGQLVAPRSLALMPLYILALLKHPAFRVGTSTRLDDRVYAMDCMKTLPLDQLMKYVYPEFYNIDVLFYNAQNANATTANDDEDDDDLPDVPRLQLSAEYLDSRSMFLLDCGTLIILYVGLNVPVHVLENVLGIKATAELPDYCFSLPNVNSFENDALKRFIMRLNDEKPYQPIVQIIRDTSTAKPQFIEKLVDDRSESSLSYYEFLQHIRTQVK